MKLYLVNGTSIVSEPFNTDYLLQTFFNVNKRDIEKLKKTSNPLWKLWTLI